MLVVWDLDLTLLRPRRFGHGCAEEVLAALGGSVPPDLVFAGRTDRAIWGEALARSGIPPGELPGMLAAYGRACAGAPWEGEVLPGAREALAAAAAAACAQTVVTGNVRPVAELKLRHAGLPAAEGPAGGVLDLSLGSFGERSGDRAELLSSTLRRWRGREARRAAPDRPPGGRAVAVGDTVHDVAAARRCGIGVVAVATGPDGADRLRAAGADAVLPDLRDAGAVVAALRSAAR